MGSYAELTDAVLCSENFIQIIKETKTYLVKSFADFVKEVQALDERIKKLGITTDLTFSNEEPYTLKWVIDNGYMNDKNRVLVVKSFDGENIVCDTNYRFRAPGSTNLNKLVDPNQILKHIDEMVYALERNSGSENNSDNNSDKDTSDETEKDKSKQEDTTNAENDNTNEDGEFQLDPSVVKVMDQLKSDGENLIKKALAVPPLEYKGKEYAPEKGEILASTEKEAVVSLLFPRAQEIDIYASTPEGRKLRTKIVNHFPQSLAPVEVVSGEQVWAAA